MAVDAISFRDLKNDIDHNSNIQEGLLSTIQTVVLKLEKKFSDLESEVYKIRREIQTLPSKTGEIPDMARSATGKVTSYGRCRCFLVKDELLSSFSKHFTQLKLELMDTHRRDESAGLKDDSMSALMAKYAGDNDVLLKTIRDNKAYICEVLKGINERVDSAKNVVLDSMNEQDDFTRMHIQSLIRESTEEVKSILDNKLDGIQDVAYFKNEVTRTLDGIQNEAQRLRSFRESFSDNLDNFLAGLGGAGTMGLRHHQALGGQDLVNRLEELNDKIQQLPNINRIMLELIDNFKEIKLYTEGEEERRHPEPEPQPRGPPPRFRRRRDFSSSQAYRAYVTQHVTPGMTVRFLPANDPAVERGDKGVVEEVDVNHVTVDWEQAGRCGAFSEDVEIVP